MKRTLGISGALVLVLGVGVGTAVYWGSGRAATGVSGRKTIQERALGAYYAGQYKEALPLFNQWALLSRGDMKAMREPVAYIQDIQERLQAERTLGGLPAKPPLDRASVLRGAQEAASAVVEALPARVPHPKPLPGEVVEMTIKDLGNFPFDPDRDADVPADVKWMDGAKVRLSGFMMPISQSEKITEFALMPTLGNCCTYGVPAGPEHIVTCTTASDHAVDYEVDELVVEGTLHVRVKRQDNYTNSIFEMDVRSVKLSQ